jgi:hypothetical protein
MKIVKKDNFDRDTKCEELIGENINEWWGKRVVDLGFSFCESIHADSNTKWHIRQLSDKGKKFGGGIDTSSLCGCVTPSVGGWDLEASLSAHHISNNTCDRCAEKYKNFICG